MRVLIQRVTGASVAVGGKTIGQTGPGLLILVCAMQGDTAADAEKMARKVAALRIFADDAGRMNLSLRDTGGSALVVSQFTLAADTRRGNRPGFSSATAPELGRELYERFAAALAEQGIATQTGEFGADMAVSLVNDGPVTIWIDSAG